MHRTLVTFCQCLTLISVIIVIANCQHCQKDEFCDSEHQEQPQQHKSKENEETSSSTKVLVEETNLDKKENRNENKNDIQTYDSSPKCHNFDPTTFGKDNSSIFVIEAKGRIGNHLMAYTIIKALEAKLKIRAYITTATYELMSMFFEVGNNSAPPVFETTFCNWHEMPIVQYRKGIDELLQDDQHLYKGHVVDLWPEGYKIEEKKCCPAQELMQYLIDNYLPETRESLKFLPKYTDEADKTLRSIADKIGRPVDEITFIGIHHRRTDYIDYMANMFNMKPLKKSFFYAAMDHFREDLEDEDTALAFLYVSDDMEWGRKNIKSKGHKDIFFVGKGDSEDRDSIGYDFALLSSCNSTIITHGSFSTWVAILAGGEYYGVYGASVLPDQQNKKRKRRKKKN